MATVMPSFDWPSNYRLTVGTTATTITLPARPGTVRIYNGTPGAVVYVEIGGTAVVPVANGAPGSIPLLGGPGSIPLRLEKGNATTISFIGSQAGIDLHVQGVHGTFPVSQTKSLLSAALDLVFADPGATLDPRITFTRGDTQSCATYFDSDGLLKTMPATVLSNSNPVWTATSGGGASSTATPGQADPWGGTTATRLVASVPSGFALMQATISAVTGLYTGAILVKSNTGTNQSVSLWTDVVTAVPVTVTPTWSIVFGSQNATTTALFKIIAGTGSTDITVARIGLFAGALTAVPYIPTAAEISGPRFDYDPATPAGTVGVELKGAASLSNSGTTSIPSYDAASGSGTLYRVDVGNRNDLYFNNTTAGKTYAITLTNSASSTATVQLRTNTGSVPAGTVAPGTSLTYNVTAVANNDIAIVLTANGAFAQITVVSVKEVTFAPKGLLIEESRTNFELQSTAITTLGGAITPSQLAPDGTLTATLFTGDGIATEHGIYGAAQSQTIQAYCQSAFVKAGSATMIQLAQSNALSTTAYVNFQLTGSGTYSAGGGATGGIQALVGGWYRIWASYTSLAGSGPMLIVDTITSMADARRIATSANVNSFTYWGRQVEVGAFPTSYIPTTTAAVTRAADNANMPTTGWYSQPTGTFVVEFDSAKAGGYYIAQASTGSGADQVSMACNAGGFVYPQVSVAGADQGTAPVLNATSVNAAQKAAISYQVNGTATSVAGGTVASDATNALPTPNKLQIGSDNGVAAFVNGHIRRLTYYNANLAGNLPSLTT